MDGLSLLEAAQYRIAGRGADNVRWGYALVGETGGSRRLLPLI